MEKRQLQKLKSYVEDIIDKKEEVLINIETLVKNANVQNEHLLQASLTALEKESLLNYYTKTLTVLVQVNHLILTYLDKEPPPDILQNLSLKNSNNQKNTALVQDLKDYLKNEIQADYSQFNNNSNDRKVSNSEIKNDSFVRKPLNDTLLKLVCTSLTQEATEYTTNTNIEKTDTALLPDIENVLDLQNNIESNNHSTIIQQFSQLASTSVNQVEEVLNEQFTDLLDDTLSSSNFTLKGESKSKECEKEAENILDRISPTLSIITEAEVYSTVSSVAYQHPLARIPKSDEIPQQYDPEYIDQIRDNIKKLSITLDFDSDTFDKMKGQYYKDIPSLQFEYEEPVKDIQEVKLQEDEQIKGIERKLTAPIKSQIANNIPQTTTEQELLQKDSDIGWWKEQNTIINEQEVVKESSEKNKNCNNNGPTESTGAVRKKIISEKKHEDTEVKTDEQQERDKVTAWLNNTCDNKSSLLSAEPTNATSSALEKLLKVKRYDRNEEARQLALSTMPDLRLVERDAPNVIKNNLDSNGSSSTTRSKTKKGKFVNKELRKGEWPNVGDVCVFSHIISPDEFYIQKVDELSTANLDRVSDTLEKKFARSNSEFKTKQDAYLKIGKWACGFILEQEAWYRLEVLDWKMDHPTKDVCVFAVDYGFKYLISYNYLRVMPKDLENIPILSTKCYLPWLYPPGSTFSNTVGVWPGVTQEAMYDIAKLSVENNRLSDYRIFEIVVASPSDDQMSLGVDLCPYGERTSETVGEILVASKLAVEITDEYESAPELGEFLEDLDELEQAENLNEVVFGYDAKDELRVCKFTRKDGSCYKGKNCKLEHIILKDGYTTDKTLTFFTAINELIFPRKGDMVRVIVTSYVDSCTYFVQMVHNPVKKANTNIVIDKGLSDLLDAMNHPKIIAKYENFKVKPANGEVVLAYYSLSKNWIRAAVRNITNASVEVYALDFGDVFSVGFKDIKVMREEFMHLPFQVIQVYLDNYQHKKTCDIKKAKRFFYQHIHYRNFLAQILSNEPPFKVRLVTSKGREIGPTLAKEGMAQIRTVDYHSRGPLLVE